MIPLAALELPGRPLSANAVSAQSHWKISTERKTWRELSAQYVKVKRFKPIEIRVCIHIRQLSTGRLYDCGSNYNAVKGAIDGLRDAKLIQDDSPKYVSAVVLRAPEKAKRDALVIKLFDAKECGHE